MISGRTCDALECIIGGHGIVPVGSSETGINFSAKCSFSIVWGERWGLLFLCKEIDTYVDKADWPSLGKDYGLCNYSADIKLIFLQKSRSNEQNTYKIKSLSKTSLIDLSLLAWMGILAF